MLSVSTGIMSSLLSLVFSLPHRIANQYSPQFFPSKSTETEMQRQSHQLTTNGWFDTVSFTM